jgi:hypothetical protein
METFRRMTDMKVKARTALLEQLAKEATTYLQKRFNEVEQESAEDKAEWDDEIDRLNEIAIKKQGEAIFSHDKEMRPLRLESYDVSQTEDYYLLSFCISDPEKPVARFKERFPGQDYKPDRAKNGAYCLNDTKRD